MIQKTLELIEETEKDAPLRRDIRELGIILGETLIEQEDYSIFETVEKLRSLTKALRTDYQDNTLQEILRLIDTLDSEKATKIVRAFSIYFILVNAADEVHRIRRMRAHILQHDFPQKGSIQDALLQLKKDKYAKDDIEKILDLTEVIPVFTAHPTEATRQTILKKVLNISQLLLKREIKNNTEEESEKIKLELKSEVTLLWQSNEIRFHKVTVKDEIQRGMFFFKNVIYNIIPDYYYNLNFLLSNLFNLREPSPIILKFGSWMGGDRDGHPFVTVDITKDTLSSNKNQILSLYMHDL